jgi:hypothetical protein
MLTLIIFTVIHHYCKNNCCKHDNFDWVLFFTISFCSFLLVLIYFPYICHHFLSVICCPLFCSHISFRDVEPIRTKNGKDNPIHKKGLCRLLQIMMILSPEVLGTHSPLGSRVFISQCCFMLNTIAYIFPILKEMIFK